MSIIFKEAEKKQEFCSSETISTTEKDKVLGNLNKMSMAFITNVGQIDQEVKYYAKGTNFGFYFAREEVILSFVKRTPKEIFNKLTSKRDISKEEEKGIGVALALQFIDANTDVKVEGQVVGGGRVNYLKGNDPEKWYTDLHTYEKVVYKDLWQGIDLVFYGAKGQLKYEFVVYPGADFEDIKLSYKGVDGISLDVEGNLLIKNELGVLIDERPVSYQEVEGKRIVLDSSFVVSEQENIYSFEIENGYNPNYPIVVDPGLIYSTYLGGILFDSANDIVIDNTGNAFVIGETNSANFPITAGAFQPVFGGGNIDSFVTKLNTAGSSLIYSTYLGGSGNDMGNSISIDNTGNAYVTGNTNSVDFPTTAGAFQPTYGGGIFDVFVTKLNAAGSALIYSTYLGGTNRDEGFSIEIDNTGNAYVAGRTDSIDFPTTAGAFQSTYGGGSFDAFVTKLNAAGSALIYSTYLGGTNRDEGFGIAIDQIGSAYVIGQTDSVDFPTTVGAFQPTYGGGDFDVFVTRLNAAGSALIYSTYLGGTNREEGSDITIDQIGNAYVTGRTNSLDFPTTAGAFQPTYGGGSTDAFVTKLNSAGSVIIYSTYLGGTNSDDGRSIAIDNTGNAYVTGVTESLDFPITADALQTIFGGASDAFVTRLNPEGSSLVFSTYHGGSSFDNGLGIAVDTNGNAYVTGNTVSADFPVTAGAFQTTFGGSIDAFISKINTNPSIILTIPPQIRIRNQNITAIVYESASN